MKSFKKMLVLTLALIMIISLCPVSGVWAETALSALPETEGVTRIGIFGDSHVGNEAGSKKMEATLQTFSSLDSDYAGLALTGDVIVQYGTSADNYKVNSAPYDYVLADLDTYANGKPYSWNMGNHEFPGACVLAVSQSDEQTALMETAIATSKQYYVEKTGMELNDDVVIGGYHFISAAPIDYSNCFDEAAESYIMERIDAAIEEDGNEKPIFLNIHHAPWYTTLSSTETVYNIPYSETLTTYLKQHPNVIIFTGHTHNSQYDPRTIWQGGYTVVNVGHTSNGGGASVADEVVYNKADAQEAIMMEISADNVVTLKKIDVKNQCYIGEDWVLDIPNMVKNPDDTNYWKYTDARYDLAPAPYFEDGASVTQVSSTQTTGTVSFPQAKAEAFMGDDIIRYYNVKVVNKKLQTLVQDYTIAADFYEAPSVRANPFVFTIDELSENTEYNVEISAVSPYGNESGTISGTFKTAESSSAGETVSLVTSPENDPRNPVYKYIATTDDDGNAVISYKELNTPGRNTKGYNKDTRFGFGGYYVAMYEAGNYISYEMTIEEAGRYEIMGIGANSVSSDMSVYIDGQKMGTLTVPVNNEGTYGPMYDGTYTSAGEVILEAGTYELMFKLDAQANSQLIFYGGALAKQADAKVIKKDYTESTTLIHNNNCTMYPNATIPNVLVYGNKAVSFSIEAELEGTYDVYAVMGSSNIEGHEFKVLVDGAECFTDSVATSGTPSLHKMNGRIPLSSGTHTFTIQTGSDQPAYFCLAEIMLVREGAETDWTWKRVSYNNTNTDITMNSANGSVDATAFGMGNGCYAEYTVTPSETGKYSITHKMAANSAELEFYINGELISDFIHNTNDSAVMANATLTDAVEIVLVEGMTYDVKLIKNDGGNATAIYTDFVLAEEITSGEGIFYDIFAGDSVNDNYEAQGAAHIKYGDGRGSNGWGCYGGLYTEFDFNVIYPGWYDLTLVLGAGDVAVVKAYVDGKEIATKNANYVSGEAWSVKRDNDFGEVFLLEGTHTLKIEGGDGNFQIFKTRIAFDRPDDGSTAIDFTYEAVDYTAKGGSNVQTYTSPYGGVVLGEGNSYTEYVVDVPAGNYAFEICYGANNWDGQMSVTLNGAMLGTYALPQNNTSLHFANYDREAYYTPEILSLNEGQNKIKLRCEKFPDGSGYAYFSFTTFKLTRITEPAVQLYHGEYITPDTQQTALADGANTVRVYMPAYVEGEAVSLIACIYEDGRLYKLDKVDVLSASVNEVMIALLDDVNLDETKKYTLKVLSWNSAEGMIPICDEVPVIQ